MLHSMTGYGTTTIEINDLIFDIELKTLNSRYLDNKIYLPQILLSNEIEIGNILKKRLLRGKVELKVKSFSVNSDSVKFNKDVIKKYLKDLSDISKFDSSILLKSILSLPNSIDKSESNIIKSDLNSFYDALSLVIDDVILFRINEGLSTKKDLKINTNSILSILKKSKVLALFTQRE